MDRLLEATARAERDHFWFHGFRRFVAPLLAEAVRDRPDARASSTAAAAPGTTSRCCGSTAARAASTSPGAGSPTRTRSGERAVAQASATHLPFADGPSTWSPRSTSSMRSTTKWKREALNEMYRVLRPGGQIVINVAAMKLLTGNHSVLGGRSGATAARALTTICAQPGSRCGASPTRTSRFCPLVAVVRSAAAPVGAPGVAAGDHRSPGAGQRRAHGRARRRSRGPPRRQHAVRQLAAGAGAKAASRNH